MKSRNRNTVDTATAAKRIRSEPYTPEVNHEVREHEYNTGNLEDECVTTLSAERVARSEYFACCPRANHVAKDDCLRMY